jgi:hypothetical protein
MAEQQNRFKNESGAMLTRGLFFEQTLIDKSSVVYTLKNEDHEGFSSLYRLYIESVDKDPTEYHFATTHLDGWDHWENLLECNWFKPYASKWRKEARIRRSAFYLNQVAKIANSGSREALTASRYMLEEGWVPKEKNTKGRPSKDEIAQEAKRQVEMEGLTLQDAERLGIRLS